MRRATRQCPLALVAVLAAAAVATPAQAAPSGLIAAYGFDESSGVTVRSGAIGADGRAVNAVRVADGRFDGGLRFNGRNSAVVIPAPALGGARGFTVEAWVRSAPGAGSRPVIARLGSGRSVAWALYANAPQGGPMAFATGGGVRRGTPGPVSPNGSGWVHLAMTVDGARIRLYRDGGLVAARRVAGRPALGRGPIRIGNVGGKWFRGVLDEVRVYRRALTSAEIRGEIERPVASDPVPSPASPGQPSPAPGGSGGGGGGGTTPGGGGTTPPRPAGMQFGVVSTRDVDTIERVRTRAGAGITRIAFTIDTPTSAMRSFVATAAANRVRPILLAEFPGFAPPSAAQARSLAAWAKEFGPGGTFWSGRSDGAYAPKYIEFGNETGYSYQGMDDRGGEYALRVKDAYEAIQAANPRVGLLVQADDPSITTGKWVNAMFGAVPNLDSMVAMWTVHPYGPRSRWEPRLRSLINQTASHGAPASIPIAITEWGLTTDNGRTLSDNYEWPTDMTYAEAGQALTSTLEEMNTRFPGRIAIFTYYYSFDHAAPGASSNREDYFGFLQSDFTDKGALTSAVRAAAAKYPGG